MRTTTLVLCYSAVVRLAAQNLIPNPGFEEVLLCPDFQSQLDRTAFWFDPSEGGTPDFYHACATDAWFSTPQSTVGFQEPADGQGYSGIFLWFGNVLNEWREFIEVELTEPLVADRCYHLTLHANLADYSGHTTDALGARFYPDSVLLTNPFPPGEAPHIELVEGSFLSREDWTILEGDYIAMGGERFVMIGNYRTDAETSTQALTGGPPNTGNFAYALIDAMSLVECTTLNVGDDVPANWRPFVHAGSISFLGTPPRGSRYRMLDSTGRVLGQGRITSNTIPLPGNIEGVLLFECEDGRSRRTFRFISQ